MKTQERLEILKNLNDRPEFKDMFIELYGIKEPEVCTCRDGDKCSCSGKHPNYFDNWQKHFISSNEEFYEILQERPNANFGIKTGNGLVVIDVDTKDNGFASLEQIKKYMPDTFTVRTGSGGLHFFYSTDKEIKNRTRFMDGLDVRGDGGYVVAPTSRHKCGNYYQIENDTKIQPITQELLEIITTDTPKEERESRPIETTDTFGEGERHDKMVKIAGNFYRQGLSEKAVLEALQNMNETLCNPPLPYKEIKNIAKSLAKYKNAERNPELLDNDSNVKDKIAYYLNSNKGNKNKKAKIISELIINDLKDKGDFIIDTHNKCYFFMNSTKVLTVLDTDNIKYRKMIMSYGINPHLPVYKFIYFELSNYCIINGKVTEVYKYAHYNTFKNVAYVKCGNNQIYIVAPENIRLVDNGTDGVLFSDEIDTEPFKLLLEREDRDYIYDYLIDLCNFNDDTLANDTQRKLAKTYFLSLFMPEFLTTKPILTMVGAKGSAKTTLLKAFTKALYGKKHNVCTMPSKIDDLDVLAANSHFLAIDNLDTHKEGLNDKLAVYATGGYVKKRKLYTDGEIYQIPIDTFIGISTRSLSFRRDDVLQRLILLELKPIVSGYIPEQEIMKPILENRDSILSQALEEIQCVMDGIKKQKFLGYKSDFRMADFAYFFTYVLNDANDAEKHLNLLKNFQINKSIDCDVLLPYLMAYAENPNSTYYTANQIYNDIINKLDSQRDFNIRPKFQKSEFEKSYDNVYSFAKRLNNIRHDIKDYLIIESRQGHGNCTEYCFKKGDKFDEIDYMSIVKPKKEIDLF